MQRSMRELMLFVLLFGNKCLLGCLFAGLVCLCPNDGPHLIPCISLRVYLVFDRPHRSRIT